LNRGDSKINRFNVNLTLNYLRKMRKTIILFLGLTFLVSSCLKDTCNQELGNTFNSIAVDSVYTSTDSKTHLALNISTLDVLPLDYFIAPKADSVTQLYINTVQMTKTTADLLLSEESLPDSSMRSVFNLVYSFGDRRTFIDCSHPGMSDRYQLHLNFELENEGTENYVISSFTWEEFFLAGAL